jgi:adenylate cyclase class IV
MPKEDEQKYRTPVHEPLERLLRENRFEYVKTSVQKNYILVVDGRLMRLRETEKESELTFKDRTNVIATKGTEIKSRDEANESVESRNRSIIAAFCKVLPHYTTERRTYVRPDMKGLKVELDTVRELGRYTELEGQLDHIVDAYQMLKLDIKDLERHSYSEMIIAVWIAQHRPFPTFFGFHLQTPSMTQGPYTLADTIKFADAMNARKPEPDITDIIRADQPRNV